MKKILAFLMILVMALSLMSCKKKSEEKETTDVWKTQLSQPGKLTIAIESAWAPFCYTDDNETIIGYCADMVEAVANYLGLETELQTSSSYDTLLASVDAGRADLLYQVAQSNPKYYVTSPHLFMRKCLVVSVSNDEIKSFNDLKGKLTANALGGSNAAVAAKFGADVTKATTPEGVELIHTGRADCVVEDEIAFNYYLEKNPEAATKVKVVDYYADTSEGSTSFKGFGLNAVDAELCAKIDAACKAMLADGTFYDIGVKWFGEDVIKAMPMYSN